MKRRSRAGEVIDKINSVMAPTKKDKALERLRKALDEIAELKALSANSPQFEKWRRDTRIAIVNTFGGDSDHIGDFGAVHYLSFSMYSSTADDHEAYTRGLESAAVILESMIDEIKEYWEDERKPSRTPDSRGNERINTKEVFVVHGRDEGAREKVARFLERLDLRPVVLHEKPNEGRTIIEKIENYTQVVGFAVILLTPDDEGRLKEGRGDLKPRARQNVVFELGYFIGKLGRGHVCALVKGEVEKPSDYDGVVYIPLDDSGGWEKSLIQELKSAGYDIDANRAFAT